MVDFINTLPPWPNDPMSQVIWVDQLKTMLTAMDTSIKAQVSDVVLVQQTTEPSQGNWETAYTSQTGNSLPIPASTELLWWDTTNDVFGGLYGTLSGGDGTVYAKSNRYSPGNIIAFGANALTSSISVSSVISGNADLFPTLTATLPVKGRFWLYGWASAYYSSGTGNFGMDFIVSSAGVVETSGLVAGTIIGRGDYNIAVDQGLGEISSDGVIQVAALTREFDPDTYTIGMMLGGTGAGPYPTIDLGGNLGVRLLYAKGIAT